MASFGHSKWWRSRFIRFLLTLGDIMSRMLLTVVCLFFCQTASATFFIYNTTNCKFAGYKTTTHQPILQPFVVEQPYIISNVEVKLQPAPNSGNVYMSVYDAEMNVVGTYDQSQASVSGNVYSYSGLQALVNPGTYYLGIGSDRPGVRWTDTKCGQWASICVTPVPEPSTVILASIACVAVYASRKVV